MGKIDWRFNNVIFHPIRWDWGRVTVTVAHGMLFVCGFGPFSISWINHTRPATYMAPSVPSSVFSGAGVGHGFLFSCSGCGRVCISRINMAEARRRSGIVASVPEKELVIFCDDCGAQRIAGRSSDKGEYLQ